MAYHWPGNIRELRNVLERAAILCEGGLITHDHLALPASLPVAHRAPIVETAPSTPALAADAAPSASAAAGRDLHAVERAMIDQALKDARFNKSKAAKALGLTRHQLYVRLRRHGRTD